MASPPDAPSKRVREPTPTRFSLTEPRIGVLLVLLKFGQITIGEALRRTRRYGSQPYTVKALVDAKLVEYAVKGAKPEDLAKKLPADLKNVLIRLTPSGKTAARQNRKTITWLKKPD